MEHYRIYWAAPKGNQPHTAIELPWEENRRETTNKAAAIEFVRSANRNNGEDEGLMKVVRVNPTTKVEAELDLATGMVAAECTVATGPAHDPDLGAAADRAPVSNTNVGQTQSDQAVKPGGDQRGDTKPGEENGDEETTDLSTDSETEDQSHPGPPPGPPDMPIVPGDNTVA